MRSLGRRVGWKAWCPGCPPGFFEEGFLVGFLGASSGSAEGGVEELVELV